MEPTYGLSLPDVLRSFYAEGFKEQFRALPGGAVECGACKWQIPGEEVSVARTARIEGVSDPGEQMLVAGTQCPHCARSGTLILAFGPRARRADAEVLERLPRGPRRQSPSRSVSRRNRT